MNLNILTGTSSATGGNMWTIVILYAAVIGGLYLLVIRPQSKKKKNEEKMRHNVQIGDEITTIGGVVGRVVGIKEDADTIVIETGTDRAKMRIKRWAIGSIDTIHEDAE
nr:preprotein translocase subunit YajC [uncultured Caproiciproducens sp.]